ncbi:NAD-binding protein, partial [Bordetella petrii]
MSTTLPAALANPAATHAVVVGGGTMGADVAVVLARARCHTTVVEPDA